MQIKKVKVHKSTNGKFYQIGDGRSDFSNLLLIGGILMAQRHGDSIDYLEDHEAITRDAAKSSAEVFDVLNSLSESAKNSLNKDQLQTYKALTYGISELLGQLERAPESLELQEAQDNYLDSVGRWFAEGECLRTLPAKGKPFADFYASYDLWCFANDMSTEPENIFKEQMLEDGRSGYWGRDSKLQKIA